MSEPAKIYFDATLTPNKSLSGKAFGLVMILVGVISFLAGIAFISMGALPVIGFFGLDALAIWFAFRMNFRSQKQETHIRITAEDISLLHTQPGKPDREARIPTAFARVDLMPVDRGASELRIGYGARCWVVGRFLAPHDRESLTTALKQALQSARAERYATD